MNCLAATLVALLLAPPGRATLTSAPPLVVVSVSARGGVVGQPITLTLQTAQPVGTTIRWKLVDEKIAADTAVAVLQVSTRRLRNATVRHEVVFTRAQGGTYDSGQLRALRVRGNAPPDTLNIPAIRLHFQPEAPRSDLHALRPVMSWQQAGFISRTGVLLLASLVLGAGGVFWVVSRRARGRAARQQSPKPAQTRQQALYALAELERGLSGGAVASRSTSEQLHSILTSYLAQARRSDAPVGSGEHHAPHALVDGHGLASRNNINGLLNELSSIRFAPNRLGSDGLPKLLARAQELVGADETAVVPEKP